MTEEERKEILDWVYKHETDFKLIRFNRYNHTILRRKTDEYSSCIVNKMPAYDLLLPRCIWEIKDRIIQKEGVEWCKQDSMFQDFIVICKPSGSIHKHKDESYSEDLIHARLNVFLELPVKGGATYYSSYPLNGKEGEYVLCKSGLHTHWCTTIEEGNRITISFGFLIPKEKLDTMISFEGEVIWKNEDV